ncbi:MAG: tetratricopeptide repeat protein, partial [Polyangiaceae bacterium]|nr:tetratricopeptide repeat protein [Polyangiaceae bacterium]
VTRVLPPGTGAVMTVAVGADADTQTLSAMARGGGGVMIPYVPGERTTSVALRVLGACYGIALRSPTIQLPDGFTAIHPATLDNIPAGGETIVVARMRDKSVKGNIKLSGFVGKDRYEQTYPIELSATTAQGNAFVPRLYAATRISDLEATNGESAKNAIVDLSKRYAVASSYTSLLVLESAAMFKAFGVDRNTSQAPMWTGEEAAVSTVSDGSVEYDDPPSSASPVRPAAAPKAGGGPSPMATRVPAKQASKPPADTGASSQMDLSADAESAASDAMPAAPPIERETARTRNPQGRRGLVPMRRVWDRTAAISMDPTGFVQRSRNELANSEREFWEKPDSRTRLQKLLGLYSVTGQLQKASELAEKWASRDALDPDALINRADIAARSGQRTKAIRILEGLADARPGDHEIQAWLAGVNDAAGNQYRACSHLITLATLRLGHAESVAAAVQCARQTERSALSTLILADIDPSIRNAVDRELAKPASEQKLRGDVRIEAAWDDDVDLDIALISRSGRRYSWIGDPKSRSRARNATSGRTETLAVFNAPQGEYLIEVTRAASGSDSPVRGTLTIRAAGVVKEIPFVLSHARVEAGSLRIFYTSRLVPVTW